MPRERTNAECHWIGDTAMLAPPGDPARRAHLLEDVRVAEDLGVRHADAVEGRRNTGAYRSARARCTEASLQSIMRQHGVSRAEVTALAGARELWVDLLAVFLPMAIVFATASRAAVKHLLDGYAAQSHTGAGWRAASILVLAAPAAAALALAATQAWGTMVEIVRLGNEHIGPRAAPLPASRHGWLVWAGATALFAVVAAVTLRQTRSATRGRPGIPGTER